MKFRVLILKIFFLIFVSTPFFGQGVDCANAEPFCTGTTPVFPASTSTTAAIGPNYGCLGSQPNPAWFYLQIANSGPITLDLSNSAGVDIDFILWGPFTSQAAGCASGLTGSAVDCSFSGAATETCTIPSAVAGEVYILLITNYSGSPTNITFFQSSGSGTTDCTILCNLSAVTATPTACDSTTITYGVSGTITYSTPPATGTLTITNSCTGASQVFNPPFPPTSVAYSLAGLPANGAPCTVTAVFSADTTCTLSQTYSAPAPCAIICNISAISTATTPCDLITNTYDLGGLITFINAPSTGTFTITNSCGGAPLILSPPFSSPLPYSFTSLTSNGLSCTINAAFSADPACIFSQVYTAPAACITCPVTATNNGPICQGG